MNPFTEVHRRAMEMRARMKSERESFIEAQQVDWEEQYLASFREQQEAEA